ncbi:MAG: hypothetical protein KGR69_12680 [Verrucomicrobia bacterium]|nr:hypothetical protein [Verrucomicrobiota bacterium]
MVEEFRLPDGYREAEAAVGEFRRPFLPLSDEITEARGTLGAFAAKEVDMVGHDHIGAHRSMLNPLRSFPNLLADRMELRIGENRIPECGRRRDEKDGGS